MIQGERSNKKGSRFIIGVLNSQSCNPHSRIHQEEKWPERSWLRGLFWRLNPPVRWLVRRTVLSGQPDPRGLSHSHARSGTKSPASNLLGWHLLPPLPAHARCTWRITRQEGLPRYLKNMGHGWGRSGGLCGASVSTASPGGGVCSGTLRRAWVIYAMDLTFFFLPFLLFYCSLLFYKSTFLVNICRRGGRG